MLSELLKDYVIRPKPIRVQTDQLDVLVYVTEVEDTPSACFTGFFLDDEGDRRYRIFSADPQSKLQNKIIKLSVDNQTIYPI
jgi:hypothetical protein